MLYVKNESVHSNGIFDFIKRINFMITKVDGGIETFYDYIDNTLDFNALYQQDYCRMQGLSFIMQIAGMIFHDLKDITDKNNISLTNAMLLLKGIKMVRERKHWMIRNVNKEQNGENCVKNWD